MGFFEDLWKNLLAGAGSAPSANQGPDYKDREVNIQVMHPDGGLWLPAGSYNGLDGHLINYMMQNAQKDYPGHRVRAVNGHGRLIDML